MRLRNRLLALCSKLPLSLMEFLEIFSPPLGQACTQTFALLALQFSNDEILFDAAQRDRIKQIAFEELERP